MSNRSSQIQGYIKHIQQSGKKFPKDSDKLLKYLGHAITLSNLVEQTDWEEPVKTQAYRNCVINLVSAFEAYLKDLVIYRSGKWNNVGLNALLKESISLGEAYDLFNGPSVSKEVVIARFSSFQNIETINHVFSKLTGTTDFLGEIDRFANDTRAASPKGLFLFFIDKNDSWRGDVMRLFALRNEFVHEPEEQTIVTMEQALEHFGLFLRVSSTINRYFGDHHWDAE